MDKKLIKSPFFLLLSSRGKHLNDLIKKSNFNSDYRFKYDNYFINAIYNIFLQKNKSYKYVLIDAVEFSLFALIISKIKNLKIIFRLRGDCWKEYEDIPKNNIFKRIVYIFFIKIFEQLLKKSFLCLVVSNDLKIKVLKKIKKINIEKLRVSVQSKNTNNIKKKKYLLTITNFKYKKKSFEILKYMNEIIRFLNKHDFKLYIFGSGEYKNEFISKINKYDSKKLKVFAYKKNLYNYQKDCFAYVHFSNLDAMPRSILECMALGKPVIATNKFGIKEIIINKKNGFLINNKKEFNSSLIYLLNNKSYKRISNNVFNISKKYSHKVVATELMDKINAY